MIFPIDPRNIAGRDNIAYWENFLTQEQLNKILEHPNWGTLNPGLVGGHGTGALNTELRKTNISWMDVTPDTVDIWKALSGTVSEVNRRYFHFELTGCYESAQLGLYSACDNGHYNWHTDASMSDCFTPRKLSISLLLNDRSEFEGGDLQVKIDSDETKTLETTKGRAWFFPSWVLHRVTPVTKGVRKSLVLWVGGPPFK